MQVFCDYDSSYVNKNALYYEWFYDSSMLSMEMSSNLYEKARLTIEVPSIINKFHD